MTIYANGELYLYGSVGFDPLDFSDEYFTPQQVREALASHGSGALTVLLNSGGGYLSDGLAIYNALKAHPAAVTLVVDGIAASAGSLVAMAGDRIVMRLGSTMMIHDPASHSSGTAADHERSHRALEAQAQEMAEVYAARSGKTVEEVRKLMIAETWFTSDEAVAEGFADQVDDMASRAVARFDYGKAYRHPPPDIRKVGARAILAHAVATTNREPGAEKPKRAPSGNAARLAAAVANANARIATRF